MMDTKISSTLLETRDETGEKKTPQRSPAAANGSSGSSPAEEEEESEKKQHYIFKAA